MLSLIKKSFQTSLFLVLVAGLASCRKEGCPANQFSFETDFVDMLAAVLNFLF